jgi:hypothetical protein
MMRDLGEEASALGIARMYREFVDVFVLDRQDAALRDAVSDLGMEVRMADTLMRDGKSRLAFGSALMEMLS